MTPTNEEQKLHVAGTAPRGPDVEPGWFSAILIGGAILMIFGAIGWNINANRLALAAHIVERNADRDRHLVLLNAKDEELTLMMRIDAGLLAQALEDNAGLLAMMGPHVEAMDEMAEAIGVLFEGQENLAWKIIRMEAGAVHVDPGGRIFIGPEQVIPPLPDGWFTTRDGMGNVEVFGPEQVLPPAPEPWPSLEGPVPNVVIEPGDIVIDGDLELEPFGDGIIIHGEAFDGSIHIRGDLWKRMLVILDDGPTTDTWRVER